MRNKSFRWRGEFGSRGEENFYRGNVLVRSGSFIRVGGRRLGRLGVRLVVRKSFGRGVWRGSRSLRKGVGRVGLYFNFFM